MLGVLQNRTFRHLFFAQIASLLGTGLTTVALGLLAYELAGAEAGLVLGTALAIKMLAYVFISPIAGAIAQRFPRRTFLLTLDVGRALMVLMLPWVSEIWQIYTLVFLFQAFSAGFTPVFQAIIPDVLKKEDEYTSALSLSRLAYDLESFLSPALAAALLTVMSFHWLFLGTTLGFLMSAAFVVSMVLPIVTISEDNRSIYAHIKRGVGIYLKTPRLRSLLALCLCASAVGSMVIVNTVVYVRETLAGSNQDVALLMAAYGIGSMAAALLLPKCLTRLSDKALMLAGATISVPILAASSLLPSLMSASVSWLILGAAMAFILTPSGRLLARSSHDADRPSLFAAHFSLSHACWLLSYPLAGWIGANMGLPSAFISLSLLGAIGALLAFYLWPADDVAELEHLHTEMTHAHLHVHDEHHQHEHEGWEGPEPHRHPHYHSQLRHTHVYVIDDHHPIWAIR